MTRDDLIDECARAVMRAVCGCNKAPCPHDEQRESSRAHVLALKSEPPEKSPEVDAAAPQPPPQGNGTPILPLVLADFQRRADAGLLKYGTVLRADNGRVALVDAYQESQDKTLYLRQAIEDFDALVRERDELRLLHKAAADAVAELSEKLDVATEEWKAWQVRATAAESERDVVKARLEKMETEALEAVERAKHLEWLARGSPMDGEPTTPGASPFDGHLFVPMPERPKLCATCGYEENSEAPPIHATPKALPEPSGCCGGQGAGVRGGR